VGVHRINVTQYTHLLIVTKQNLLLVSVRPNSRKEDSAALSGSKDWQLNPCSGCSCNMNICRAPSEHHHTHMEWQLLTVESNIQMRREFVY
jgi:hypothetical protein